MFFLCSQGLDNHFNVSRLPQPGQVNFAEPVSPILKKTPYELFQGRKPNISHLRVFGYKCFILNNGKDNLGKFDSKVDEGIFLGYSSHSHTYKAYNKRTMLIEEIVHITFDETNQKL